MDPLRSRGRVIKLSGLPEVLGNSSVEARVVDATAKRVSRVSQHSPLSTSRPIPQHRISKPSTTSPRPFPQANSTSNSIRQSPPPHTTPFQPPNIPVLESMQQTLLIMNQKIESIARSLQNQQQHQHSPSPQPHTNRSPQPSPQPQHHFKPSPAPSLIYQKQPHHPSPIRTREPPNPSPTHFRHPNPSPTHFKHPSPPMPTHVESEVYLQPRVSPFRQPSRVLPNDNYRYHHQYHTQQTTSVHDINEALADVSISSREYLSRHNLWD